ERRLQADKNKLEQQLKALAAKDKKIERPRALAGVGSGGAASQAQAPQTDASGSDTDKARLSEIGAGIRAIGVSKDPVLIKCKTDIAAEYDSLKERIMREEPVALEKKRDRPAENVKAIEHKVCELQKQPGEARDALAATARELAEAEEQRRTAAIAAPRPGGSDGPPSLRSAISGIDTPIDEVGKMLESFGAEQGMRNDVVGMFERFRALDKAAAERRAREASGGGAAAPGGVGGEARVDGRARAAEGGRVPMDTGDLPDLPAIYREAFGADPPEDEAQLRTAIKRLGEA
ncbi:unnamed protein product, partial [Prorocentrum cordatum]